MGHTAYWREEHGSLAWAALGDANRGGFLATDTAVSNLEGPAAPTPPSGGPFPFRAEEPLVPPRAPSFGY